MKTEEQAYATSVLQQRVEREHKLVKNPFNWFSLVGLYPLQPGDNPLGNGDQYRLNIRALPEGSNAVLRYQNDAVYLVKASGEFNINGQPIEDRPLRQDVEGDPDLIEAGSVAMRVIRRSNLPYLRVWDRESPCFKAFKGLFYFPFDPSFCVQAQFFPFDPPRRMLIQNAIGGESESFFPGIARFVLNGVECTLVAEENEEELLFSFSDLTGADSTYPGGRYLLTPFPENGAVTLDFNQAVNWPCAYTPYATCPLPPLENRLPVRIEAGEKHYQD